MSILLQRAKSSSSAFFLCASALSLSSTEWTIFFLLLLKAVTVFQFSFICDRYELHLLFCNWFLFSFLSSCLQMSFVLCRALSTSAGVGALLLPSCQCLPAASRLLPALPHLPWDPPVPWMASALGGTSSFVFIAPCPDHGLLCLWERANGGWGLRAGWSVCKRLWHRVSFSVSNGLSCST